MVISENKSEQILQFHCWVFILIFVFLRGLPPPLRHSARRTSSEEDTNWRHGSLSDFSDYESSDEETHNARASGSNNISAAQAYANKHQRKSSKDYVDVSDDEVDVRKDPKKSLLKDEDDPFADPFAD